MKRVLVIVVTYNGMKWLERCLGSVSAVTGPKDVPQTAKTAQNAVTGPTAGPPTAPAADLYVWDNDSTDGSADFVEANYPQAKLVRSAENLGFSKPNNMGMQYALEHGYDYVYLLNQDAWLESGALEKLVAAAEAHPEYAVLSPLQMTDGYKELDRQFRKLYPGAKTAQNAPEAYQNQEGRCKIGPKCTWGMPKQGAQVQKRPQMHLGRPEPADVRRVMAAHW
ncbi:MAG: glycosyltransferase, partial [Bacteroidales bacterium]|nr:glycosyltransferase [Bacteroidales bacterium]